MSRAGSQFEQFQRRIPSDVRPLAVGLRLEIPVGDQLTSVTITDKTQAIRLSLRTNDPLEVKARNASIDLHLEQVWRALRQDRPVSLTNRNATALAGELYRSWAHGEGRDRMVAVEQGPDGKMRLAQHRPLDDADFLEATLRRLVRIETMGTYDGDKPAYERVPFDLDNPPPVEEEPEPSDLEPHLGRLVDRLLLAKGIRRVDEPSRELLLVAFWRALRDALEERLRNARGRYSEQSLVEYPEWSEPRERVKLSVSVSLTALVDGWWIEAKAAGRSESTRESYTNTVASLVAYLKHDDATRVTQKDIVGFKDHRLASINKRTGKPISATTVKDNDLVGLRTVFGWAIANGKLRGVNPTSGVTVVRSKTTKLRSKSLTDEEAKAILKAALDVEQNGSLPETHAARQWVPWLMAYTGARVGELAQLRKKDLRKEGKHWVIHITPEAGPVKTSEAREVVLHGHLVEMDFPKFVAASRGEYLFLRVGKGGGVRGPLQGVKNRLQEFAREVVKDPNVAPNHGWRHRFKSVCRSAGIDRHAIDFIQGHKPATTGDEYDELTFEHQAAVMAKIPRYAV